MKDAIYTIPITDVFVTKCGCPICHMREMLEKRCIEYIMGAAMMEPDIRIETNKYGFCIKHFKQMSIQKNRLSLALMLETHMAELAEKCITTKRKPKDEINYSNSCFVCNEIDNVSKKLIATMFKQYLNQPDFHELFCAQEYFCEPHFELLRKLAPQHMNKKQLGEFLDTLTAITNRYLLKIMADVHSFSSMFDYRNSATAKDEATVNSIERAIEFLTGELL